MRALITFAAYTGMRPGECFALWSGPTSTSSGCASGSGAGSRDQALRRPLLHATLGLPPRVIAEQFGWTLAGVLKLLAVYGHGDVGALEEIDAAFAGKVTPLRAVER